MAPAILARAGTSCATYRPFINHGVALMQSRHYADVPEVPQARGTASWKLKGPKDKGKLFRRDHRQGIFRSMPESKLQHELFETGSRPVLDYPPFGPETVRQDMIGQATLFVPTENDPVRYYGSPKPTLLEHRILSRPCSIIRQSTVDMVRILHGHAQNEGSKQHRVVITGRAGTGKSVLLIQSVQYCHAQDWIVIYVPRAVSTVNSTTMHTYDLRTQTYVQPNYAHQTLRRILIVNRARLESIPTRKTHAFEKVKVEEGSPLTALIEAGLADKAIAPAILDELFSELGEQKQHPVLLAVDDFQALYCRTTYRDPHFTPIRSYHLSIPRLLMEYASGRRTFARGAVVGAITSTDTQYPLSEDLRLELDIFNDRASSPYDKQSRPLRKYASGLLPLQVPDGLTPTEAASLFDIWMSEKSLAPAATDELFLAKYTESGGNPREFIWKGLLGTLEGPPLVIDKRRPFAQMTIP
ncbi:mitochondrial ribosomal death-associated protein 3-domain-containing protein [Armillaria borealis]|uniref:Small ribosomal subunit protein mS29 n=1 Tax=Armillaria borealis TaxID=47425 RepID=A0AA39MF34_9AGAR|nr:mitochondrial ribosomal death-associated protein 3-domain-containing protein [Armillaria borealis]